MNNRAFWNAMKPLVTNKGISCSGVITLEEKGVLISDEKDLAEIFNNHYINIVESTTGSSPAALENPSDPKQDMNTVLKIIEFYKESPVICKIKDHMNSIACPSFSFPSATKAEINDIFKNLDVKKKTGNDTIAAKAVKLSADILDEPFANLINLSIHRNSFPENAKTANVPPTYKKGSRVSKLSYRPISVLNVFSKVFERWVKNKIQPHINECLSAFISAYRKHYSTNHVILRLLEEWKNNLDNKKFVGAVLMDLSKAFDCVPHDLLIAKMHAYGFELDTLIFFYSYLKRRKQNVCINNIFSSFQILLSGVPHGSILGPILFNIFINDIFFWIENAEVHNYADDNTISAFANSIPQLLNILECQSDNAIKWFTENGMIVNPDKFHAIIINKCGRHKQLHELRIGGEIITSEENVNLLGIDIDNKLNFNKHINAFCKKAAGQLNGICRINKYIGENERKTLMQSFVDSNFNYCPLAWMHCSPKSTRKIEYIQERALRLLLNDYCNNYGTLLNLANKSTMSIKRHKILAKEIFKTLNNLNPVFMKDIFVKNTRECSRNASNLFVPSVNGYTYGENSLKFLGPRIWNSLPTHFKEVVTLREFNKLINTWDGTSCNCKMCTISNSLLN